MFFPKSSRRDFLKFMGKSSLLTLPPMSFIGCNLFNKSDNSFLKTIAPSTEDNVTLAEGFNFYPLIHWGDKINSNDDEFGFNNDFISVIPQNKNEAIMWVNHESSHSLFVSQFDHKTMKKTKEMVLKEQKSVGGSILKITKTDNKWSVKTDDSINKRLDGTTKIPFANNVTVEGQKHAIGTMANCAGGQTPWKTFLTCEENYQDFYGETVFEDGKKKRVPGRKYYQWEKIYKRPPEHYGWVVEVEPLSGNAKKLTALGRFAHEGSTVTVGKNNIPVAYMGDDASDEHLYKFISDKPGSLETGELFVASIEKGQWLSLDINKSSILKKNFKSQLEVVTYARRAAKLLGATPLDRPEDIEVDKKTGHVFVALTNNKEKGNFYGSILKVMESDPTSLTFSSDSFLTGGHKTGLVCPDNLVFDKKGNMWVTTDISEKTIEKGPYKGFGNNALFYIPLTGKNAGEAHRVANAPVDAEFTGPCFSEDGKTLFLSVQHPGQGTKDLNKPRSTWPHTGKLPKPTVIAIHGPTLDKLLS